jgi:thymidylate synthase ThyX
MPESKVKVILLRYSPNPEETVSMAAKLCYSPSDIESLKGKIEKKDQKSFVERLVKMGHMSPIEHSSFTFAIEGNTGSPHTASNPSDTSVKNTVLIILSPRSFKKMRN